MRIVSFILLGGLLIGSTGCASRGNYDSQISLLQTQLAETQAALKAEQEKNLALQRGPTIPVEPYQGAMYRTATGFQVPAMDIQKALKKAGYYSGTADGKMGPDSREALRNFQRDNGLTADGVCGRQTWNKLKQHLA